MPAERKAVLLSTLVAEFATVLSQLHSAALPTSSLCSSAHAVLRCILELCSTASINLQAFYQSDSSDIKS